LGEEKKKIVRDLQQDQKRNSFLSDSKSPAVPPLPILLIVSCSATWVVAQLSYNALPQLLVPIKVAFDRSDEVVTRMYGYELFVFAIVALAAAGPLARFSRVLVALLGGAVAVAAGIMSALTESYSVLVVCRIMLGAGGALVGVAGTAAAASSRNPQRVYAVVMIVSQVVLAFVPALLERLALGPFGLDGAFYGLAIATALLMPLFIWLLPPRPSESVPTTSAWTAILQAPNRAIAVVAMLALLVYETGQGGIWTYLVELGRRSGVDERFYGDSMAVIQLVALSGSFLAIWIGDRFGYKWPIVLGVGLNVAAAAALSFGTKPIHFVILNIIWIGSYYFVVPYLLGLMARLDDLGRWAVAIDAMWWLGDAVGPPVAGMIVERSGFELLAAFPLCTGVVSIMFFMRVLRRFGSKDDSLISRRND
jgi:predicted MFS family arabinose efflux permease